MGYLLLASLLWAPSFALVKELQVHPDLLSALRLALAAAAFAMLAAFARSGAATPAARRWQWAALGAVQLGAMYVLLHRSYAHLAGHEVALFTVLTPVWVAALDALVGRRWTVRPFAAAGIAIAGALLLSDTDVGDDVWIGFAWVQGANLCFALGQVAYRHAGDPTGRGHAAAMRWMYAGAALVGIVAAACTVPRAAATAMWDAPFGDWLRILYLGLVPTALGFSLWNRGALRVSPGVLAAANDLKVPLAVAVSLAPPFRESADLGRLAGSGALMVLALAVGRAPRGR